VPISGVRVYDARTWGGTDLTGAKLQGADLRDAVLAGYKDLLRPATLTRDQLAGAVYNGRTQWPADFRPPFDTMKWDDTTIAIRGTQVLTVKGGSLADVTETRKTVVRAGMAVERNGKPLGNHPEPVAEAEVLPCDGRQIGLRLYRPGMTRCPPIADTQCRAAREEAVSRKSVAEQLLEELGTAA
jgi:hypothetical protein